MSSFNPDTEKALLSRRDSLEEKRKKLVENKIANQSSDPAFAEEIQEEIDGIDKLLQELDK